MSFPVTSVGARPEVDPVPPHLREAVSRTLETFIASKSAELAALGDDLLPLFDVARAALSGGKRLRPAFAYWGWRAAGGNPAKSEPIMVAAAAIELVHASALVHDDVMDDSATRRGRLAAQHAFARLREPFVAPEAAARFGRSAAILLGDMLLSWSDELLERSAVKAPALARSRVYFNRLRTEVVAGQYLDVLGQTTSRSTAADAMRVIRYKSAKYTIERPLQFGAALGNADRSLLEALSSYGVPLGEAFQLRDDILGVFGDAQVTGKPSGDDVREGKRTLLMARAMDLATPGQRTVLDAHVGDPDLDADGIDSVQHVLRDSGALHAVETVISELTSAARSALRHAPIESEEVREALFVLTDRATRRSV